ncbi:MAG: DUF2809 domain-containing protein [Bacteroidales bacterium]|nr:DUF2809 domain-containing protein [Bacteroidales bacterium]
MTKFYKGFGFEFIQNHLGGVIYVVFWILFFSIIFPKFSILKLSIGVFLVTSAIEFTQLIHTPFLDSLREHFVIRALMGSTFNPFDFIWYLVGALLGYLTISLFFKKAD